MSEDSEESTKFIRQRRDLFVISGLLLLIECADITFNQISLIGMSIDIGNPSVLKYFLWIIWIYWYLRYFQAFLALHRNLPNEAYDSLLYHFSYLKFNSKYTKNTLEDWNKRALELNYNPNDYSLKKNISDRKLGWFKATFKYSLRAIQNPNGRETDVGEYTDVISGLPYFWVQIRAISSLIFSKIEFTEYIFPFIFGLLPPVVWALNQFSY